MLQAGWSSLRIGEVVIPGKDSGKSPHAFIHPGTIDPKLLDVQLYAEPIEGKARIVPLHRTEDIQDGWIAYETDVNLEGEISDYTLRIIPVMDGLCVPLEAPFILWQR